MAIIWMWCNRLAGQQVPCPGGPSANVTLTFILPFDRWTSTMKLNKETEGRKKILVILMTLSMHECIGTLSLKGLLTISKCLPTLK
jgi:hypothetical protein